MGKHGKILSKTGRISICDGHYSFNNVLYMGTQEVIDMKMTRDMLVG